MIFNIIFKIGIVIALYNQKSFFISKKNTQTINFMNNIVNLQRKISCDKIGVVAHRVYLEIVKNTDVHET